MEISEFTFTHTSQGTNYIDLTKTDTLANCKGKYQFRNGKPLAYVFSARLSNNANKLETIPTGWVQKNALVKTSAAWEKMYRKAGLTRKDLNTYGKEMRLTYDAAHSGNYGHSNYELIADGLAPHYTSAEYMETGDRITVYTIYNGTPPASFTQAFDQTVLTVPHEDGNQEDERAWTPFVIGAGDGVLAQYIISRGQVDIEDEDLEQSSETVYPNSYLRLMLSDNEETSDDVLEDHADHGDYRPYDLTNVVSYSTISIEPGANVAGQDTTVIAPLGLLRWTGSEDDKLFLRLEAIVEM